MSAYADADAALEAEDLVEHLAQQVARVPSTELFSAVVPLIADLERELLVRVSAAYYCQRHPRRPPYGHAGRGDPGRADRPRA